MREVIKIEAKPKIPQRQKRVAAYARVSSGKDAMLHSLSAQISHYNNYITRRSDWEFAGIYADEAMSGTKDNRLEFQRMLADCRLGKIDMIITKSITRFARNTVTLLEVVRELKLLGIDVFFEKENIYTLSADGEFMLSLLASFAQEESRSASENQNWRIKRNFEQGKPCSGKLLGYRMVDGKFHIVPEEAEMVKQIFADYLSGMGTAMIVRKFNEAGIKTRHGCNWSCSGVSVILRNEKYTGDMLLQKTYRKDHISKKTVINHGEKPMYYVEDSHEAIIDKETFAAVQKEIERRAKMHPPRNIPEGPYPFNGLIRCGICGDFFRHRTIHAGSKCAKSVWICYTYNKLGKSYCASRYIPENILIALTLETLGIDEISRELLMEHISKILIPDHRKIVYVFRDGRTKEVEWQHLTRRSSWTPEMRQKVSEQQLKRNQGGENHEQ